MLGKSTLPRTTGVHISQIYGDLYQRLEPDRYTKGVPPPEILEVGLSFEYQLERMLEDGLKARLAGAVRPGELISPEGIYFSPDLMVFNGTQRVGEIKLTWMSTKEVPVTTSNSFPPKFDKWFTQMKSYCHLLETPLARLIAFFVLSDYGHMKQRGARPGARKGAGPDLRAWDIEFTARELKENWALMLRHGQDMGVLGANGKVIATE